MPSPKLEPLVLTDEERGVLEGLARRRKTAPALRSRIVLACAAGDSVSGPPASGSPGRRRGSGGRGSWRAGCRG